MAERAVRVAVIGGGMSGILAAIRLQEAGIYDFTVYEKAGSLGGTWRDNDYPGLSCDIPSHVYSYSFAPNPNWSHRFAPGAEIRDYLCDIAQQRGIFPHVHFHQEVTACRWDGQRWQLTCGDGDRAEADCVIAATGVLHHPNRPEFKGLSEFAGAAFHSARFRHDVPLDGRRVGIVGTGSTAAQLVGALIPQVEHLALFQRTAQWIFPSRNAAYSAEEQALFRRDPAALRALRRKLEQSIEESFADALADADSSAMHAIEEACRLNLEEQVLDPQLRERLRPDYRAACKRLVVSDRFYEAIQSPNASLVTSPIDHVEAAGVVTADGQLHPLDVLILATGFRTHDFMRPMRIVGHEQRSLDQLWGQAPFAYRTVSIPNFPNFFMLVGPHSPVGNFSLIEVAELQMDFILQLMSGIQRGTYRAVCASDSSTAAFNMTIDEAMRNTIWVTGCRSWYLDEKGKPAVWPWGMTRFRETMRTPNLDDFDIYR